MSYDPRTDYRFWKDVVKNLGRKYKSEALTCELCNTENPINVSLLGSAASAFTNYKYLCKSCAHSLGFTVMIEGD